MKGPLLVSLTIACVLGDDSAQERMKREIDALQGTWTVSQARRNGKKEAALVDATVIVEADHFISKAGETMQARGIFKLDIGKSPKKIDLTYTDGPEKGQRVRGIYTRTKSTWILLFSAPGENRPDSFEKDSEPGFLSLILKQK
jgi:uncharacterized protein (TIGR03067 family)